MIRNVLRGVYKAGIALRPAPRSSPSPLLSPTRPSPSRSHFSPVARPFPRNPSLLAANVEYRSAAPLALVLRAGSSVPARLFSTSPVSGQQAEQRLPEETYPPVMAEMLKEVKAQPKLVKALRDTVVGMVQHLDRSTLALIHALIQGGMTPSDIFVAGKYYSQNEGIITALKNLGVQVFPGEVPAGMGFYREAQEATARKLCRAMGTHLRERYTDQSDKKIVLLDSGHELSPIAASMLPIGAHPISAIAYTAGGLQPSPNGHPIKDTCWTTLPIAGSAMKRILESLFVADAARIEVEELLATNDFDASTTFAVMGNGAVGSAVARALLAQGFRVFVYDPSPDAFDGAGLEGAVRSGAHVAVNQADVIIGCTGTDLTPTLDKAFGPQLERLFKNKYLVSFGSGHAEFEELCRRFSGDNPGLQDSFKDDPFGNHVLRPRTGSTSVTVVYAGAPLSFRKLTASRDKDANVTGSGFSRYGNLTGSELFCGTVDAALRAEPLKTDGLTLNRSRFAPFSAEAQRTIVAAYRRHADPELLALVERDYPTLWDDLLTPGFIERQDAERIAFLRKTLLGTGPDFSSSADSDRDVLAPFLRGFPSLPSSEKGQCRIIR